MHSVIMSERDKINPVGESLTFMSQTVRTNEPHDMKGYHNSSPLGPQEGSIILYS